MDLPRPQSIIDIDKSDHHVSEEQNEDDAIDIFAFIIF